MAQRPADGTSGRFEYWVRVWRCDVYRAGDGVHRAWLNRRRKFEMPLQRFVRGMSRKHQEILKLEESLFAKGAAGRVIAGMFLGELTSDQIHFRLGLLEADARF